MIIGKADEHHAISATGEPIGAVGATLDDLVLIGDGDARKAGLTQVAAAIAVDVLNTKPATGPGACAAGSRTAASTSIAAATFSRMDDTLLQRAGPVSPLEVIAALTVELGLSDGLLAPWRPVGIGKFSTATSALRTFDDSLPTAFAV